MTALHVLNQTEVMEVMEAKESNLDAAAAGLRLRVFLSSLEEDKGRKLVKNPWRMIISEKTNMCKY